MTYDWQSEHLRLEAESSEHTVHVTLIDRRNGKTWGPTPVARMEIYNKSEQRLETINRFHVDACEPLPDGLHVTLSAPTWRVQIGLWIRLVDGELSVLMPMPELYELWPDMARLFAVQVLPELASVAADGRLILPFGEGASCAVAGKAPITDRGLVYMEQSRWELGVLLPVIAASAPDGGLSLLHRQGATDGEWHVQIDAASRGTVGLGFSLRRHWVDPVDATSREIRVTPIAASEDAVLATAKRLRRHVMDDLGKRTIRERAAECPDIAYLETAIAFKAFFGIENEGLICQNWDKSSPLSFKTCMTFAEAEGHLQALKDAGVEHAYNQLVGWNCRGHDGLYPTRFPVEERVGGEAGLKRLVERSRALGYRMTFHDNFMMNIPHSPDFDADCVVQDVYGGMLLSGWWSGGLEYTAWPLAYPEARLGGYLREVQARFGLDGPYYCDYMMRPLEVNYHPTHGGPRRDSARGQARVLEEATAVFGSSATEFGGLPAVVACDYISAAGQRARNRPWPIAALIEQDEPLWQLALGGLVIRERNMHPTWTSLIDAVAMGRIPRDEWSTHAKPMPQITPERIARLAAVYRIAGPQHGRLRMQEMTNYQRLADGVWQSTFADGTQCTVDENETTLLVDGKPVERPEVLPIT